MSPWDRIGPYAMVAFALWCVWMLYLLTVAEGR